MKHLQFNVILAIVVVTIRVVTGYITSASSGDCVCATTTVNARSKGSLSGTVVLQLHAGDCGQADGEVTTSDGYTWIHLTYLGQKVWVAGNYLTKGMASSCGGWSDIGYSFLIGGDGSVFEGRGWDKVGAHTGGYNSVGFGFCFIGSFMTKAPPTIQITRAKQLIQCGVAQGKLNPSYTLRGHRDMSSTDCPGDTLYSMIRTWPHY